jgi:hypothetical protein
VILLDDPPIEQASGDVSPAVAETPAEALAERKTSHGGKAMPTRGEQVAQTLIVAALYAVPALLCAFAACANDPDIWWHLRTGQWILQHHAVPHTDPFSTFGTGKPWAAYSWLFELIVLQLFQHLGLVGIVIYSTTMVLAITVALHHLIKRLQPDFSLGVLLTLVASLSIARLYTPRPWHFTILFFVLVLDIVMYARRTGRTRELAWLPVIFALWANLHIQFVDGLAVLGLAAVESVAASWWHGTRTRLHGAWMVGALFASVLATLLNPYGWGLYKVAHDLASQPGVMDQINELKAIPFRGMPDYCVLFLTLASAAVLARMPRVRLFELGLFAFAVVLTFRSQRDVWVMAAAASAIIASGTKGRDRFAGAVELPRQPAFALPLIAVTVTAALVLGFHAKHVNNQQLAERLRETTPVAAVDAVKARGYAGPLYNDYVWGGYLMWALRQPVSMDGRSIVHGEDRITRFNATWNAEPDWRSDKDLAAAGLVIGPVKSPLTQVLRLDPRFELVYEDKLAAVFVAHKAQGNGQPAASVQ